MATLLKVPRPSPVSAITSKYNRGSGSYVNIATGYVSSSVRDPGVGYRKVSYAEAVKQASLPPKQTTSSYLRLKKQKPSFLKIPTKSTYISKIAIPTSKIRKLIVPSKSSKLLEKKITGAESAFRSQSNIAGQDAAHEIFVKPYQTDISTIPMPVQPMFTPKIIKKSDGTFGFSSTEVTSAFDTKIQDIKMAPAKVAAAKEILDPFYKDVKQKFFTKDTESVVREINKTLEKQKIMEKKYNETRLGAADVVFTTNLTQSLLNDLQNNNNTYSKNTLDLLERNKNKYDLRIIGLTPRDTLKVVGKSLSDETLVQSIVTNKSGTWQEGVIDAARGFSEFDTGGEIKRSVSQVSNKKDIGLFTPISQQDIYKGVVAIPALGLSLAQGLTGGLVNTFWKEPEPEQIEQPITKIPDTDAYKPNVEANIANLEAIKKYNIIVPGIKVSEQKMDKFILDNKRIDDAAQVVLDTYDPQYIELYDKYKNYYDEKANLFDFKNDTSAKTDFIMEQRRLDDAIQTETGMFKKDIIEYIDKKADLSKDLFGEGTTYDKIISENYIEKTNEQGQKVYVFKDFEKVDELFDKTADVYAKDKSILEFTPRQAVLNVEDFTTRRALQKYGTGEKEVNILGIIPTGIKRGLDSAPLISTEEYLLGKNIFTSSGFTPKEAEQKYLAENLLAPIAPYIGPQGTMNLITGFGTGISKGIRKGMEAEYKITDSLIPGYDAPIDLQFGDLKIGETSFRMGARGIGETIAGTGEAYAETGARDYLKSLDKYYNVPSSFEKMREGDIQATGQAGRIGASVVPLIAGTIIGGPAGVGIVTASSVVGAGESETSEELTGNILLGTLFATGSGGIRALGKYTEAAAYSGKASKLTGVSKVLGVAEKVVIPAFFAGSTLIEGAGSVEAARQGREEEAKAMDRRLRAMLGGVTLGAMIPGAITANVIETLGGKITVKKYPTGAKEVNLFNPTPTKSGPENIYNMMKMDGKSGNKFSAILNYGKQKVKMFFYNDVGVKGKLGEKVPGFKEIAEDQFFTSISKGKDIGKKEFISKQQPAGAEAARVKEGLLDQFFGFGQRYPVKYYQNTKTGESFAVAYTGYATGKTTYQDTRGLLDVLTRKQTGVPGADGKSLVADLGAYGKRIATMATKTDIMTPSKLYQNLFGDNSTYVLYSKSKLVNIKPKKGETLIQFLSRVKSDPANVGKQIFNPAELGLKGIDGKPLTYNETASILISQGIDPVTGKFILGSKVTEIPGQRNIIFAKDTGRISTAEGVHFLDNIGLTSKLTYLTTKPVITSAATWEDIVKDSGKQFADSMKELNIGIETKNAVQIIKAKNITALEAKLKIGTNIKLTPAEKVLMPQILQKDIAASLETSAINRALSVSEPALTQLQQVKLQEILAKETFNATRYNQLRKDISRRVKDNAVSDMAYTPQEAGTMEYFLMKDMQKYTGQKSRTDLLGRILGKQTKVGPQIQRGLRKATSTKLKTDASISEYTPGELLTVDYFLGKDVKAADRASKIKADLAKEGLSGYEQGTTVLRDRPTAIIKNKNGDILLVKDAKTGRWDLPGGGRGKGESADYAMVREIFEETGLTPDFTKTSSVDVIGGQFKGYTGELIQNRNIVYEGIAKGTIKIKKGEISDARFFTPNQVIEKINAGATTKTITAAEQGYTTSIFKLNPKTKGYAINPWDNLEYQQNMKIATQKSIPKWDISLPKSFVYGSTPKLLQSEVLSQLSFPKLKPVSSPKLTSSQKELFSNIYSQQISSPSKLTSSQKSMVSDIYSQRSSPSAVSSPSYSPYSPSSSPYSPSSSPYSPSSSPYSPLYPQYYSLYGAPMPLIGGAQKPKKLKVKFAKGPGRKQLIQVKSSLFRKFAFGEKDLLVDKESLAQFKRTIGKKGTFFGYDAVPTQEQLNAAEDKLWKSQAEAKYLKGQKSILDIEL